VKAHVEERSIKCVRYKVSSCWLAAVTAKVPISHDAERGEGIQHAYASQRAACWNIVTGRAVLVFYRFPCGYSTKAKCPVEWTELTESLADVTARLRKMGFVARVSDSAASR